MSRKYSCAVILGIALLAGCARQPGQQAASTTPLVGYAAASQAGPQPATQPPALPQSATDNPEPTDRSVAPPTAVQPESPAQSYPASSTVGQSAPPPQGYSARPAVATEPPPVMAEIPADAVIPAGTQLRVRLGQSLDTRVSRRGERFVAYLAEPIVLRNRVVAPRGTEFMGHVVEARPSGRLKGRAYLGVTLDSFRLRNVTYRIATGADVRASRNHKRRNLAIIGGGSGGGALIGGLAGGGVGALIGAGAGAAAGTTGAFITGKKNVRLPVETPLVFSLRTSVAIRG